jgi:hypothetical protein
MALLATQNVSQNGITPVYSAANAGGDTFRTGKQNAFVVKNGGGAPITVTISTYPDVTSYGAAIPDLIVSVPAAGERWIGPFDTATYGSPTDEFVHVAYSAITTVTVGVFAI